MARARFNYDPRRDLVQAERHARPPLATPAPALCQHIVFHGAQSDLAYERRACLNICEQLELLPSSELNDQIKAEGAGLTLKWERHTEFSSYTFIAHGIEDRETFVPWGHRDLGWEGVPGKVLVELLIGLETYTDPVWSSLERFSWSGERPLCASLVMSGTTEVESDLLTNDEGITRYLVKTSSTEPSRLGRLVQRLLEIETYGALCLYAWKDVKEIGPLMGEAEGKLSDIIARLARKSGEPDEMILNDLTELSSFHEATTARSHFRLNASLAYHEIVVRRLSELREERVEGCQRLANFIQRRMNPAARTYRAILTRQEETALRISRATQLLRGRIEVAIGKQNQALLASMNERAEAQYKLQKTVEGLSVVAISYYALGIIAYLAAAFVAQLSGVAPGIGVKEIVGFAVPLVLIAVWVSVRKLRD
ncbi:MAG: DUF3422 domain-containing protein [Pseudomonadota bacterium]